MGYWQDRQTALYEAGEMQVNAYFTRLEKAFNQTKRELQRTIESFYQRYAKTNGVSYAEAQRLLSATEMGELKDFIALVKQNIGQVSPEAENLSLKSRVTRYEALQKQTDAMLQGLYAERFQRDGAALMKDIYTDTYARTWFNIDQYRGFHSDFAQVDPKVLTALVEYPFDGASFSSRIWKQKDALQASLTESLTRMLVTGQTPQDISGELAKRFQTKKFEAYRLLHTESSFIMEQATHAGYEQDEVEKYQILATLDSKTCGICGELDGKVFPVKEAVAGVNQAPFHPFCRCTDVPFYDDGDLEDQTRAARDENGDPIEVPATMTYEKWKEKYTGQGDESDATKGEYLIRNHEGKKVPAKDKITTLDVIQRMPSKVQEAINNGTVIDIGKTGSSQYDYINDILYIASGASEEEIQHEIGHLIENKLLEKNKVNEMIDQLLGDISKADITIETYVDHAGNERHLWILHNDAFVSEYQGRLYINSIEEAFNAEGTLEKKYLREFVSEAYREYCQNPEAMKKDHPEQYKMIEEAVK